MFHFSPLEKKARFTLWFCWARWWDFLDSFPVLFSRFHGLLRIFTSLPLAVPFTQRFFQNLRVIVLPMFAPRYAAPAAPRVARLSRVRRERRTAFSGLLCWLRTNYRHIVWTGRCFFEPFAALIRLDRLLFFEPFSRLFIVKVGHCFFIPFVFSSYIFSMTNTGNIQ